MATTAPNAAISADHNNSKYNQFQWSTYPIPSHNGDATNEYFTIRHLKQGRTGARKTWPAAEMLLEYLVRHGGLQQQHFSNHEDEVDNDVLNLTEAPSSSTMPRQTDNMADQTYNIVEIGGGTGFLSVGLALALNQPQSPNVRLLCTDHDAPTLKNMRFNVAEQPRNRQIPKSVRVQSLDWGDSVGGDKFSRAVRNQFVSKGKQHDTNNDDPICRLTHLIGSDVHWGEATLEPLSSVISGFKLRNPRIIVILLLQERTPNAVASLQASIEDKVHRGSCSQALLDGFSVRVREIVHSRHGDPLQDGTADAATSTHTQPMKLVEC